MLEVAELRKELKALATKERQLGSAKYFKTGPGEYGEGDTFIGVTVPDTRKIAKQYKDLHMEQIDELAHSKIHEERLCALLILNHRYSKAKSNEERIELFEFWLVLLRENLINNWDLIFSSGVMMSSMKGVSAGFVA